MLPGNAVEKSISGRTILITGAGGSIGSALVKTIATMNPRKVVLLDSSERNLHGIDFELGSAGYRKSYIPVLGDICDLKLLRALFCRHRPEIVYHAAAFKHVPLMESNPFAAVRNNALGTYSLASVSGAEGASTFVMISTDKAVNPISVMGVSKRIAELALLSLNNAKTRMCAVRLRNVLGSQGSVVPIFLHQISQGGPVTVTDRDASRYFLTIDEAVELILLASALEDGGGVFVPQFDPPVNILHMAVQLIADAKSESRNEIPIVFTGLRPGDKLSEEFLSANESAEPTSTNRLFRVKMKRPPSFNDFQLDEISRNVDDRNLPGMMDAIFKMVPDYRPTELLSCTLENSSV
jgi:FlaA1/EpsC-like NDP-sugar epimerase